MSTISAYLNSLLRQSVDRQPVKSCLSFEARDKNIMHQCRMCAFAYLRCITEVGSICRRGPSLLEKYKKENLLMKLTLSLQKNINSLVYNVRCLPGNDIFVKYPPKNQEQFFCYELSDQPNLSPYSTMVMQLLLSR